MGGWPQFDGRGWNLFGDYLRSRHQPLLAFALAYVRACGKRGATGVEIVAHLCGKYPGKEVDQLEAEMVIDRLRYGHLIDLRTRRGQRVYVALPTRE